MIVYQASLGPPAPVRGHQAHTKEVVVTMRGMRATNTLRTLQYRDHLQIFTLHYHGRHPPRRHTRIQGAGDRILYGGPHIIHGVYWSALESKLKLAPPLLYWSLRRVWPLLFSDRTPEMMLTPDVLCVPSVSSPHFTGYKRGTDEIACNTSLTSQLCDPASSAGIFCG